LEMPPLFAVHWTAQGWVITGPVADPAPARGHHARRKQNRSKKQQPKPMSQDVKSLSHMVKHRSRCLAMYGTNNTNTYGNEKHMLRCTGCGSTDTIEEIRAKQPGAISCCPERQMADLCPRCYNSIETWWRYCAMCGAPLAVD
jgi:hypothetical protein